MDLKALQFILLLTIGAPQFMTAQQAPIFEHLLSFDSIELVVTTDMRQLWNKRDDQYIDAQIEITADSKTFFNCAGQVRTRGNSRKEICDNPPVKIRFDKDALKEAGMHGYKTLKLVNPCHSNQLYRDLVKVEYAAYRVYELLTDKSFRVKEVDITYKDSNEKRKDFVASAFLIEHEDHLADRLGGEIFEVTVAPERIFDRETYLTFSLFQYFIGNTDWSVVKQHNSKYIKNDSLEKIYPIPYDFDYAGMINAEYAVPDEKLAITNVTQRLYRGPCMTEDELDLVVDNFEHHEDEIINIFQGLEVNQSKHKFCLRFSDSFFSLLENRKKLRKVVPECEIESGKAKKK